MQNIEFEMVLKDHDELTSVMVEGSFGDKELRYQVTGDEDSQGQFPLTALQHRLVHNEVMNVMEEYFEMKAQSGKDQATDQSIDEAKGA